MTTKSTLLASAMQSIGGAILNEISYIDGKRDNAGHADRAIYLAKTLQIPPIELPLVIETINKQIDELDGHVSSFSAVDAERLRAIRKTIHLNARASAESSQFARTMFAKLGMDFGSDFDNQLDLGTDGTMTKTPDRTKAGAKSELMDPEIAEHALHSGDHRSNGRDKTVAA